MSGLFGSLKGALGIGRTAADITPDLDEALRNAVRAHLTELDQIFETFADQQISEYCRFIAGRLGEQGLSEVSRVNYLMLVEDIEALHPEAADDALASFLMMWSVAVAGHSVVEASRGADGFPQITFAQLRQAVDESIESQIRDEEFSALRLQISHAQRRYFCFDALLDFTRGL